MSAHFEHLSPDRLFEAAEAALIARDQLATRRASPATSKNRAPLTHPAASLGTPAQPEVLRGFSRHEVLQACEFLSRLGLLSLPRPQ